MSKEELTLVKGGVSWGLWGIAGAIATFILGICEGITNPIKCGK